MKTMFYLRVFDIIHGFWGEYAIVPETVILEVSAVRISLRIERSKLDLPLPMSPRIITKEPLLIIVLISLSAWTKRGFPF